MEIMGIEIRRSGMLSGIYADVDRTLQKANMNSGIVSSAVKTQALAHALTKMLRAENYFNVCTIDTCAEMCQVIIPKDRKEVYRAAHCIHYNEMLPEYRATLTAMVLDDFRCILYPNP